MRGYTLVPTCRICSHCKDEIRDSIDADLVAGETITDTCIRYRSFFPKEYELTENALIEHKKHLMEWLATAKLSSLKIEGGKLSLVPEALSRSREVDEFVSGVSHDVARGIVNEPKILQNLIIDSYKDLERCSDILTAQAVSPKYIRSILTTKDSIRKNLMDALQRNVELRQKIGGDIDKTKTVQEVLKRVIACCIKSLKVISVTQEEADAFAEALKDSMYKDTEISKFMVSD